MAQQPDDEKPSSADQQAKALGRLKRAIAAPTITHRPAESVPTRARRVRLCQAIQPEDTYESIAKRNPALGDPEQISKMLSVLRRTRLADLWVPKSWVSPFRLAQAYLASIPKGYRLPTED